LRDAARNPVDGLSVLPHGQPRPTPAQWIGAGRLMFGDMEHTQALKDRGELRPDTFS
jgi:hypothetical protein